MTNRLGPAHGDPGPGKAMRSLAGRDKGLPSAASRGAELSGRTGARSNFLATANLREQAHAGNGQPPGQGLSNGDKSITWRGGRQPPHGPHTPTLFCAVIHSSFLRHHRSFPPVGAPLLPCAPGQLRCGLPWSVCFLPLAQGSRVTSPTPKVQAGAHGLVPAFALPQQHTQGPHP